MRRRRSGDDLAQMGRRVTPFHASPPSALVLRRRHEQKRRVGSGAVVGIDLGTTNSAMAVMRDNDDDSGGGGGRVEMVRNEEGACELLTLYFRLTASIYAHTYLHAFISCLILVNLEELKFKLGGEGHSLLSLSITIFSSFLHPLGHYQTPSCVSFANGRVLVGESALRKKAANHRNTVYGRSPQVFLIGTEKKNFLA